MKDFLDLEEILAIDDPKIAELYWQKFFREKTPMGKLFGGHKMYGSVSAGKGITLIHVTTSLSEIEKNGYMYASGGCLGASIYVVPLNADGTLHNLTRFLLDVEVPRSLKAQNRRKEKIELIAIHIPQKVIRKSNLKESGFDYLTLGTVQSKIFRQMLDLNVFSEDDIKLIKREILEQINSSKNLFQVSTQHDQSVSDQDYFYLLDQSRKAMPFLGYIYFETLIECICLLQDDNQAMESFDNGELLNSHFKTLVFDISPNLFKAFKLVNFSPDLDTILNYLEKKSGEGKIFNEFSREKFAYLFRNRICQNIRLKTLGGKNLPRKLTFDSILENNPELIGHLFHKTVREIPNLAQQHFLYEEIKAEVIWNEWNRKGVICPYNSIVPKGEMGINPRYPKLSYKIYTANIDPESKKLFYERELNVKLAPKLINPSISLMGAPHKLPFNI